MCSSDLGLWRLGLRLKEQKGPRRAPHPWSQRAGDLTGSPAGFWGSHAWGTRCLSSPAPPVCEGPSPLTFLISLPSLLCPQGPTWPGGGLWRTGDRPGSPTGSLCPSGQGNCPPKIYLFKFLTDMLLGVRSSLFIKVKHSLGYRYFFC